MSLLKELGVREDASSMDLEKCDLVQCTYRYLQQLAKCLALPSNVKKIHLMEMIYAKKHKTTEELNSIVSRIKEQRKLNSRPRKNGARKKKRLQGPEVSSTSNHSPPICSTPRLDSGRVIKKSFNTSNPIPTKATESDRVLRSYDRVRNTKYSIVNYNNTVVGVIQARNSYSQEVESQYERVKQQQKYVPLRVTDCVQRQRTTEYELPHPKAMYIPNQQQSDWEVTERQLVPVARTSNASAIRERRVSGVYPLETKQYYKPRVGYRRQDGRISKINAVVQRPTKCPERVTDSVQKSVIYRPIIVSLKSALRSKPKSLVRHSRYDLTKAIETETPRMITSQSFQETFENSTLRDQADMRNKSYLFENQRSERHRAIEAPKRYSDYATFNESRMTLYTQKRVSSLMEANNNRNKDVGNNSENSIITALGHSSNDSRYIQNQPLKTYTKRSRLEDKIFDDTKSKSCEYVIVISKEQDQANMNSKTQTSSNNQGKVSMAQKPVANVIIQRKEIDYPNMSSVTVQTDEIDVPDMRRRKEIVNPRISAVTMQRKETDSTMYAMGMRKRMDRPNMSALTDVYPTGHVQKDSMEPTTSEYYHKKIRAEQIRTQRLSLTAERQSVGLSLPTIDEVFSKTKKPQSVCMERDTETSLPAITDVFSKFHQPQYEHLTQPLYVDCGDDVHKDKMPGPLEGLYNYCARDLVQPLDFHHVMVTTDTSSVYSTHTMTTVVAQTPSTSHAQCTNCALALVNRPGYMEPGSMPLHDYLANTGLTHQGVMCDEVLQKSADSPQSSQSIIEDALELISQDGDYMERIGMDVRMQCVVCEWSGPKSVLEYHVGLEHSSSIVSRSSGAWSTCVGLGRARGVCELSALGGRLYVLRAACAGDRSLRAALTVLPKDTDTETYPKFGRITTYNKVTGEPHTWEGIIPEYGNRQTDTSTEGDTRSQYSPNSEENLTSEVNGGNESSGSVEGLVVDLSSLDLLPNSANLNLIRGEWIVESNSKVVVGSLQPNDIEIVIHVQIYD